MNNDTFWDFIIKWQGYKEGSFRCLSSNELIADKIITFMLKNWEQKVTDQDRSLNKAKAKDLLRQAEKLIEGL